MSEIGSHGNTDGHYESEYPIHPIDQRKTRVLRVAQQSESHEDFLDQTSASAEVIHDDADSDLSPGSRVGPYKLLQEIGVGGMGVVFMAEQSVPVRRKVAVKIIKFGMDTRNFIARFEAERQALAMMDHPNITKVYDAGRTSKGRPYFAMELVSGMAITEYCDKRQLSLRQRLELFQKVCHGVQHAHQKGIIHRDLKPSNVMVTHYDGVAVPKIIDFGIAKAIDQSLTEKTLFTSYGNMIGTPEYMSPEQAEMSGLDIDTRSDVYSLGVVLYELLTGTTPFYKWKQKGFHKFCQAICNEEPELASTRVNNTASTVNKISRNRGTDIRSLNRLLRGDIDWILVKCMAKDRNQRYETASDLARDVQRYLDGQPIEAAGPRISYRARKFVTKHRTALSFVAVMLLSLIGATIISTLFAIQATKSQRLANSRLEEVDRLREEAVAERDRAQAAENQLRILERQSRNEAATARAITRFREQFPNGLTDVKFPARIVPAPKWSSSPMKQTFEEASDTEATRTLTTYYTTQELNNDSAVQLVRPEGYVCNVVIASDGELSLIQDDFECEKSSLYDPCHEDQSIQMVVMRDPSGADPTDKFLGYLADEQRQLFGDHDRTVANTLFEMGTVALRNENWPLAEDNFRKSLKILEKNAISDERLAKVEMFLGKALLHQDKLEAAKERLMNGLQNADSLGDVSEELVDAYQEVKADFEALDIPVAEFGKQLKQNFGGLLKKAVENHLKFEAKSD